MKYRKKPVEIEAILFGNVGENLTQVIDFVGMENVAEMCASYIVIRTLEGDMKANAGDYVIKGVQGEFYPCKPDIFEQTYDRVEE